MGKFQFGGKHHWEFKFLSGTGCIMLIKFCNSLMKYNIDFVTNTYIKVSTELDILS